MPTLLHRSDHSLGVLLAFIKVDITNIVLSSILIDQFSFILFLQMGFDRTYLTFWYQHRFECLNGHFLL